MKTACFVFRMIGCAVLMYGTSFAAWSGTASQQGSANSADLASDRLRLEHTARADGGKHQAGKELSDEQRGNRRASDKNHPPNQASLAKANRPSQLPNRREHSVTGNAMNLHRPGSDKSRGVANDGLMRNETVKSALPVGSLSVVRPTAPSLNNVRHRGANPAVIGGLVSSKSANTGAINGTRMNHRP